MADIKGPGGEGSTQGQIDTPMSKGNVSNEGDGKIHDFSKATGNPDTSGGGPNDIEGPGMKGSWTGGINITGTNKKY
jgi:hypothetical protein